MPRKTGNIAYDVFMRRVPFLRGALVGAKWVRVYRSKGRGRGKQIKWHCRSTGRA